MDNAEVLKTIFPLLDGVDLASCMSVSRQWRDIARDDYYWRNLCSKKWPSICKRTKPPSSTYYEFYRTFYRRIHQRPLPPPRVLLSDLEFFIDIWADDTLIFSEVVPAQTLDPGIRNPPEGVSDLLRFHLDCPEYRMTLPLQPGFAVPMSQTVRVSVLVGRKDSGKVARVVDKSVFDYMDRTAYRALAFDYLDFSPVYPFTSGIRAWISLLFVEDGKKNEEVDDGNRNEGVIDVFGIQMDFCDVANTKEEVLWLLDMLDWK